MMYIDSVSQFSQFKTIKVYEKPEKSTFLKKYFPDRKILINTARLGSRPDMRAGIFFCLLKKGVRSCLNKNQQPFQYTGS